MGVLISNYSKFVKLVYTELRMLISNTTYCLMQQRKAWWGDDYTASKFQHSKCSLGAYFQVLKRLLTSSV